ncbi:hypothetical protein GQ457_17G024990 [Hibiscus cannabinus]
MMKLEDSALACVLVLLASGPSCMHMQPLVRKTLVRNSSALGAFCLDGSPPAYHLQRGFGDGANNWILFFEGGGCDNASHNPDFYNWNRVKLRYCDGASFTGDGKFDNGTTLLYFRGKRIWEAIVNDLLSKGLANAHQALLTGCSAGGLATFLHCDSFARMLPKASVKCLSDAGFFLDVKDVSLNYTIRSTFKAVVSLQGVKRNLDRRCRKSMYDPELCFFPQYTLKYITTPFFVLNSVYDAIQFHRFWVPYSADVGRTWGHCRHQLAACNADQIAVLQGFRHRMLKALSYLLKDKQSGGTFITSCLTHCQSNAQELWFAVDSPRIHNKTMAEAVGDWYFDRRRTKEVDCGYPCDTCRDLAPLPQLHENQSYFKINAKMKMDVDQFVLCLFLLLVFAPWSIYSDERLLVGMTIVQDAAARGAVCLDGSLPAYHLHRGFGDGSNNWLLQFEGGGWCNDVSSCLERAKTRRGSTHYMEKFKVFSGILSNNASLNPDFYNWNRVKLRYCDGASFSGDGMFDNGVISHISSVSCRDGKRLLPSGLIGGYGWVETDISSSFRGQKIWEAIIYDLLPQGLSSARMALLSGCSAGGLATFLHCDNLSNIQDISLNYTMRSFYNDLIALQFHHGWFHHLLICADTGIMCKFNPAACDATQIDVLQGFRRDMLRLLTHSKYSSSVGMFINSCFAHCQSESQELGWLLILLEYTIRPLQKLLEIGTLDRKITKEIDCPYPCDKTCQNIIPSPQVH